jgi:hypothetical protein
MVWSASIAHRSQHDDRNVRCRAQAAAERQAVLARQHHIEGDQVEHLPLEGGEHRRAVRGSGGVAVLPDGRADLSAGQRSGHGCFRPYAAPRSSATLTQYIKSPSGQALAPDRETSSPVVAANDGRR